MKSGMWRAEGFGCVMDAELRYEGTLSPVLRTYVAVSAARPQERGFGPVQRTCMVESLDDRYDGAISRVIWRSRGLGTICVRWVS